MGNFFITGSCNLPTYYINSIQVSSGTIMNLSNEALDKIDFGVPLAAEIETKSTLNYMLKSLEEKDYDNLRKWMGILQENLQRLDAENPLNTNG